MTRAEITQAGIVGLCFVIDERAKKRSVLHDGVADLTSEECAAVVHAGLRLLFGEREMRRLPKRAAPSKEAKLVPERACIRRCKAILFGTRIRAEASARKWRYQRSLHCHL